MYINFIQENRTYCQEMADGCRKPQGLPLNHRLATDLRIIV